jgi:hypothetical protein
MQRRSWLFQFNMQQVALDWEVDSKIKFKKSCPFSLKSSYAEMSFWGAKI